MKAKAFRKNLAESNVSTAHYESVETVPSLKNVPGLKSGLRYQYFEEQCYVFADEINAIPVQTGVTSSVDVSRRRSTCGILFQFDGYIHIYKNGSYRFYLYANAYNKLDIGGKTLRHFSRDRTSKDYQIFLEAGYYPIRVLYTNNWIPGPSLELRYEGPGMEKQIIPENVLFHVKDKK